MVLIFSENNDWSTKKVLEYLNLFNTKFAFFSELDVIEVLGSLKNNESKFRVLKNEQFVCFLDDIDFVWYRRVDVTVKLMNVGKFKSSEEKEYAIWYDKMRKDFITHLLHSQNCLGVFGKGNFNKLEFLLKCKELNIKIPNTLLTNSKIELCQFLKKCQNEVIVKSFLMPYAFPVRRSKLKETWKRGATIKVEDNDLKKIPSIFDLSLFQERLDKRIEIRVFYLNGECYSQAIFSQKAQKSKIDYRLGLGDGLEMRQCFFKLPALIEKQVDILMKELGLDIGSLDIVVTKNNEYVFLEVNPSGQYGDASENTNTNLEYKIANVLINVPNERKNKDC